jgi:hypothetical protein
MQIESLLTPFFAAAAFLKQPLADTTACAVSDAYDSVKSHMEGCFAKNPDAHKALQLFGERPGSAARQTLLKEECVAAGLESDTALHLLVSKLTGLLPVASGANPQQIEIKGNGNRVNFAGRDLITTERIVQRNSITPDDRHITAEQRRQICSVIAELATRLAGEDGRPNFAAGHRMLQRRFKVASYVLLPQEQFEDALTFLKQQRAIHRSRLRRRSPFAYQADFFRTIFATARTLGWDGPKVYEFAEQKLQLKKPITSLSALGTNQLKTLAELMRREDASSSGA